MLAPSSGLKSNSNKKTALNKQQTKQPNKHKNYSGTNA
jgi:hypothetical protein